MMPTAVESRLAEALDQLRATVESMSSASPRPDLLPLFARIDELAAQLPPDADPTLRHYLEKKSYEKARLFLAGRDVENRRGSCR